MKTTNLFIDFLILGFICIVTFTLPILLYFQYSFDELLIFMRQNSSVAFISIATIFTYIIGIIYNQLVDIILKQVVDCFDIKKISETQKNIEKDFNVDSYHSLVQLIVLNSQSSYDYLSFRRTMIRIIRALLLSSFLMIIIHLFTVIIGTIVWGSEFSIINSIVILILIFVMFLSGIAFYRLNKGYFNAVRSLSIIIKKEE